MKNAIVTLILAALTTTTASAGVLSFMTKDGHTSVKNGLKVKSAWTILEGDGQGNTAIGLMITDSAGRVCSVRAQQLPGVDMAALAINLKNFEGVTFVCKIDKLEFPQSKQSESATAAWVAAE